MIFFFMVLVCLNHNAAKTEICALRRGNALLLPACGLLKFDVAISEFWFIIYRLIRMEIACPRSCLGNVYIQQYLL